jgi:hypothetical protein
VEVQVPLQALLLIQVAVVVVETVEITPVGQHFQEQQHPHH